MKRTATYLTLTSPEESRPFEICGTRFLIRRLSLGEMALLEKRLLEPGPGRPGQKPVMIMPPKALQAEVLAHCLTGWENLLDSNGERAGFSKEAARRLPARTASLLAAKALRLNLKRGEK